MSTHPTFYGISRNGQPPYIFAGELQWLFPVLDKNQTNDPEASWQIVGPFTETQRRQMQVV